MKTYVFRQRLRLPLLRLIIVVDQLSVLVCGLVHKRWRRHRYTIAGRLETVLVCTVLDDAHFAAALVHIAVLALHLTGGQFRFDLERSVGALIAVRV